MIENRYEKIRSTIITIRALQMELNHFWLPFQLNSCLHFFVSIVSMYMYIEKYRKLFIDPKMNRRKCNEESLKFSSIAIPNGIFYIQKQLEFNRS